LPNWKSTYGKDRSSKLSAKTFTTNPDDNIKFVFNAGRVKKTISLNGSYVDAKNDKFLNQIVLGAYRSAVLIKNGVNNIAPTVTIITPVPNKTYTAAATINIIAAATDQDGTISKVEFYNGTKLLHTEYNGTYSYSWTNVPAGTYSLTAKATDNKGSVTTSAIVKVLVKSSSGNRAPSVSIKTPVTNTRYTAPATINMIAAATDKDGTISKVQFYNGTKLLDTESQGTYSYSWKNVRAGIYTITAKATDNKGATTTSSPVKVTVVSKSSRPSMNNSTSSVLKNLDFKLFPNPGISSINLNFNGSLSNQRAILTIQSSTGSLLKKYPVIISGKSLGVDIFSLNTGMYIITLSTDNFTITKNFIKVN
jgi:hypothetical protein